MTDLLVRGGTVVTVEGSRRADVAMRTGESSAIERGSGRHWPTAREVVDADGTARAPRCRRRPHPHPGRQRRRARPVLPGLGRGGVRRHDHVPRVQQPGHRHLAGAARIAARRHATSGARRPTATPRSTTASSLVDQRPARTIPWPSCRPRSTPACRPSRPSWSTTSASMTRALAALRRTGRRRRHARGPLRGPGDARGRWRPRPWRRRDGAAVPCRLAAADVRGRGTARAIALGPGGRCAALRRPPVLRRGAAAGRGRRAEGQRRVRRDVSALPDARRSVRRARARRRSAT